LDELLPENISDCFDTSNFTILDLNFWLSSYGHKIWMSKLDFGYFVKENISIYEPLDLISLLDNLELNWKKYIRINDFDLPWNFANGDVKDVLSLDENWISWGAFTIITTWSILPEIVRAAHILNENGLFVDIFILNRLDFDLDNELENLMKHNKNVMFVLDLLNASSYEDWIKNKLKDINIKFIYPKYEKLTTTFGEYKNEETLFDAEGLVNRLG